MIRFSLSVVIFMTNSLQYRTNFTMVWSIIQITLLLSALLTLSCFADVPTKISASSDDLEIMSLGLTGRIVNGTKASRRQFPYQVSLRRSWSNSHFCGGSIISTTLVVTAAHCMFLSDAIIQPWMITIVAGELKLNETTSTGQIKNVEKIKVHPDFVMETLENDVAVLKVSKPFVMTLEVNRVPLTTFDPMPNTICRVAGWGYPASNIEIVSNDLMYVDLPVPTIKQCRELLVNVTDMPPGMFCAGYLEGMKDTCQGDSGGGMLCNGILTGITSGGEGCAAPMLPGVYTSVNYFKQWISDGEYIELAICRNGQNSIKSSALVIIAFHLTLITLTGH